MGLNTPQWLLVQLYMEMSKEVEMLHYGVYHFKWYISHFEDGTLTPIDEFIFWT